MTNVSISNCTLVVVITFCALMDDPERVDLRPRNKATDKKRARRRYYLSGPVINDRGLVPDVSILSGVTRNKERFNLAQGTR